MFLVCVTGTAQRMKQFLRKADTSFAEKSYFAAYRYYDAALAYDSTLTRAWYYKAESARQINALDSAITAYQRTIRLDDQSPRTYPDAYVWMGISQQQTGRLEEARAQLEAYLQLDTGQTPALTRLAEKCIRDLDFELGPPVGEATNLGDTINSPYSDFGPRLINDQLYFSSLRFDPPEPLSTRENPRKYSQIMVTDRKSPARIAQDSFNQEGVNSAYLAVSADNLRLYYGQCEYIGNSNDLRCDLMVRTRTTADQPWGPARKLSINQVGYNTTQPALGLDSTGREVLYFVSDRPGSKGGLDIWYGPISDDGDVPSAVPLNSLNTAFDEAAPFYHEPSRRLFFASKGYPSLGDYDLYYSIRTPANTWSAPIQLPKPYNSRYADVHYVRDQESTRAVYSSTRLVEGAQLLDERTGACCHDLYETPIPPLDLIVQTKDALDSTNLDSVLVKLYEIPGNGDTLKIDERMGYISNLYTFRVDRYKDYLITGSRTYYTEAEEPIALINVPDTIEVVEEDLYLKTRTINLTVLTFDASTSQPLDSCRVQWFAGDANNQPLQLIAQEINGRNDNQTFFPGVELHEPYTFLATRNGFFPEKLEVVFDLDDVKENSFDITVILSLERIGTFNMFFDNDFPKFRYPDGQANPDTTRETIKELVVQYAKRKDTFTALGRDSSRLINEFFSQQLLANMVDLENFVAQMLPYLREGFQFTISLRGYASPLGNQAYNKKLTERRIVSILNFFREYNGGVLKPYIDGDQRGRLTINRRPNGEDQIGKSLEDFRKLIKAIDKDSLERKTSQSVFSLSASIERRVEVTDIRIDTDTSQE